jgi:hypothetical protein
VTVRVRNTLISVVGQFEIRVWTRDLLGLRPYGGRRTVDYDGRMAKRSRKPRDLNRLAASIVGEATDEREPEPESQQTQAGRQGGLKGGRTRAERLSAERRSAIARKAARARWKAS